MHHGSLQHHVAFLLLLFLFLLLLRPILANVADERPAHVPLPRFWTRLRTRAALIPRGARVRLIPLEVLPPPGVRVWGGGRLVVVPGTWLWLPFLLLFLPHAP
jgi:hypothetical protein